MLVLIVVGGGESAAGLDLNGFTPKAGEGAAAISQTAESYDHFWRGSTRVSNPGVGEVSTLSSTLWLTWGFTDNLSVVGNIAFVDADGDGTGGFTDSGIQDIAALLQYRFASVVSGRARHDFLVAGGFRTPLADYEPNAPVSLGDGTDDGLFRFVYHYENGPFYLSQQLGFDLRGSGAPNGFPVFTELGYTVGRFTVSGFYNLYLADGGTDIGDPGFTFPSNQDEFERVGAKLFTRLRHDFGISVLGFTTLSGRNSGDTSGISLGGSYSF